LFAVSLSAVADMRPLSRSAVSGGTNETWSGGRA
jgi:hypothetical protein